MKSLFKKETLKSNIQHVKSLEFIGLEWWI